MTREEYIESVVSQIDDRAAREEFRREISAHLDDRIAFYTDAGYDYGYALDKAIGRMGDTETVGAQMNNIYDTTKANIFTWIMSGFLCLLTIAFDIMLFGQIADISEVVCFDEYYSIVLHTAVVVFAIVFWLATKHKNYKALMTASVVETICCYIAVGNIYFFDIMSFVSPLLNVSEFLGSSNDLLTDESVLSTFTSHLYIVFGVLAVVYFMISGFFGILTAAQIKSVVKGTARTKILKRYQRFNFAGLAVAIAELLSVLICVCYIVDFLRNL